VKSIDSTFISPRIDEPELDSSQGQGLPSKIVDDDGQYFKDPSWTTAAHIGASYAVRLPINTEPQRATLAKTIAKVLGTVKLVGCGS
jgi:hypothetical protein